MISPEEARELIKGYPEELHLVGGPYCGAYLLPRKEQIWDVHRQMGNTESPIPWEALPTNFFPISEHSVVFHGPHGDALYIRGDDLRWSFSEMVYIEGAGPA
jgi:hypothetical protein